MQWQRQTNFVCQSHKCVYNFLCVDARNVRLWIINRSSVQCTSVCDFQFVTDTHTRVIQFLYFFPSIFFTLYLTPCLAYFVRSLSPFTYFNNFEELPGYGYRQWSLQNNITRSAYFNAFKQGWSILVVPALSICLRKMWRFIVVLWTSFASNVFPLKKSPYSFAG